MDRPALPFAKMHGCANDYVVVDAVRRPVDDPAALARAVCDRRRGVGSDGLLLALPSEHADLRMRMFNPDGSEAEMCGNGLRCLVLFARSHDLLDGDEAVIETGAGALPVALLARAASSATVAVEMGMPTLDPEAVSMPLVVDGRTHDVAVVGMGNPHAVLFVDDVDAMPLPTLGPAIERHDAFPQRTNVEFVQVLSPTAVRQRTWERGAGETPACGTGACAVAVAGVRTGRTQPDVTVHLRGGDLEVRYDEARGVRMTGPAVHVFDGRWPGA